MEDYYLLHGITSWPHFQPPSSRQISWTLDELRDKGLILHNNLPIKL